MPTRKPQANATPPPVMDPVADLLGGGRVVSYKVDLALLVGSVTAGLLLSQLWYWANTRTAQERDGWFYVATDELSYQTGMIRDEIDTARTRLKDLGLIEEDRKGVPARLWYRLDKARLYELLREFADFKAQIEGIPQTGKPAGQSERIPQTVMRKYRNLARGKAAGKIEGYSQPISTENSLLTSSDNSLPTRAGAREDPPINPPEGDAEGGEAPPLTDRLAAVWAGVLEVFHEQMRAGELAKPTFQTHLIHLRLCDLVEEGGRVDAVIAAPSDFTVEWVGKRHRERIAAALACALGKAPDAVDVHLRGPSADATGPTAEAAGPDAGRDKRVLS
jgi:hypothetical protein